MDEVTDLAGSEHAPRPGPQGPSPDPDKLVPAAQTWSASAPCQLPRAAPAPAFCGGSGGSTPTSPAPAALAALAHVRGGAGVRPCPAPRRPTLRVRTNPGIQHELHPPWARPRGHLSLSSSSQGTKGTGARFSPTPVALQPRGSQHPAFSLVKSPTPTGATLFCNSKYQCAISPLKILQEKRLLHKTLLPC